MSVRRDLSCPPTGLRPFWIKRASTIAAALAFLLPLVNSTTDVRADTLLDAFASAYRTNPKLDAARATLRATDEEIARANAGYRPTFSASADTGHQYQKSNSGGVESSVNTAPRGYGVQAVQPVFSGGRVRNAASEAEATVGAGRETLRAVEQTVLLDTATAYMDVVRDQAIVRIRENSLNVLSQELHAVTVRKSVGDVTRTDVAQTEARRAAAISALDAARTNLRISRATFERHTGRTAERLAEPKTALKHLPRSLDDALSIAKRESPAVVAAVFRELAARFVVERIRGELMPSVQVEANYSRRFEPSAQVDESTSASVLGRLTVPLYSGGEVDARVRQAKHTHAARTQEIQQARQETENAAIAAWAQYQSANVQLVSDTAQLSATRVALEGVRTEQRAGQRTVLDVLNAEQDVLTAEVTVIATRRNIVVTGYSLLAAIGRLNIGETGAAAARYDPAQHTDDVRHRWRGTEINNQISKPAKSTFTVPKSHDRQIINSFR